MARSYVAEAYKKFMANENREGIEIIREGLTYYRDRLGEITNETATDLDMGLLIYAFNTMVAPLREIAPEVKDMEKLCEHLFKTVVITVPQKAGGDAK